MDPSELTERLALGEDSRHQFKADVKNDTALAAEMMAFANSGGGHLFIGVDDNGGVVGLTPEKIRRLNQLVANAASQKIRPPLNPVTENMRLEGGVVMVVTIADSIAKPHTDLQGAIWVRNGADKRRVTAREEMQRLFQTASLVHADVVPVAGSTLNDLDVKLFHAYYHRRYGEEEGCLELPPERLLENLNLARDGSLNLAGLLLFGQDPQRWRPQFLIKGMTYPGREIDLDTYMDCQDLYGAFPELFRQAMAFMLRNLRHIQRDQGINSKGLPEIPRIVLEEIVVNALVHRDYFVSAPIRIFIFSDRVEIISPGHLPNNLRVDHIRHGITNLRNPVLASHASHLLPYQGIGTGIMRALRAHPAMTFDDDRDGNQFKVCLQRP
ncbi:MAG: putative DNA binding domain-containing protein [Magnetococcales bacterium]|nr:putative DNA binding domain-containing protein [Magnetococcales bacterium]